MSDMFENLDLSEIQKEMEKDSELRDLTCEEIKDGTRIILKAIEQAYARNWIHSEQHHLQDPEPVFDAEEFADDITDILFDGDTGDFFLSVLNGFQTEISQTNT